MKWFLYKIWVRIGLYLRWFEYKTVKDQEYYHHLVEIVWPHNKKIMKRYKVNRHKFW